MVAVVSGSGLGLDNTSLRQLGQGLGGQAAIGQSGVGQYLNAATGNLVLQNADEGLIFDGLPLDVLRTYNSQGQLSGNQGWLSGFSRSVGGLTGKVNHLGSKVVRTADDGSTVRYDYDVNLGMYVSQGQNGALDTLSWDAATSDWSWSDRAHSQQETYNASGQLTALSDTQTGAQYSFSYSGSQLSQITAGDGDTLLFGYNTANQLISLSIQEIPPGQTTAVTRQQVGYTYDGQGRLSTVTTTLASDTDPSGTSYATTYTYDGSSDRVASVTQSDGTAVSYTYAADSYGAYRVASMTTGAGAAAQTLALSYDLTNSNTTVTDSLGRTWTYTYGKAGRLLQATMPAVNGSTPITTYQYDANGNLLQMTDANGGVTSYSYDANGNLLSVEDATGHTVSYTYNADDQVLSQTTYTVPAQGIAGQHGYIAPSGAQTTYDVYDASDRLSYVVDPLGNVTEHDYATTNGTTVLSSTKQYLGATYSLTGLSPSTPPTLATLQSWVASSPVQATLAQSTRTDYSYDARGQLATQTQWDTVASSGVGVLDAGTTITTTTYDAQGRLLQTATERGSNRTTLETTSYAYDGLGRLISRTDPLGQVTSYVYTDSGSTLAITQANDLVTTQVRNSAGLLISSTQSASGQTSRVTSYLYNALGQNVATIDPAGNVSYTFYDADGRVAGTVDATGAVTAISYDADGHATGTTQYATQISTSGWVSGGALTASLPSSLPVPTATANDRTRHVIVDAAGREIATIDAAGSVSTTTYDGEGNATTRTAYATALTPAQLTALGSTPTLAALRAMLSSSVNDRTSHVIYDADGRSAATIDAAGFVTITTYDTAGRAIKTAAYATALTSAQLGALGSTPGLAALQADLTASAGDQTMRTTYDGEGRVIAQVDADGYLTTTAYDETTHTITSARYATALTSAQLTALTGSESMATLVGLLGGSTANQQSSATYDADNQLVSATAVDGTVTTNRYNLVGQLLSTTVTPAAGQGTARTTSATYDAFGDTLTRVDGNQATTTYTYNALGQRTTATDALGNSTYTYYDADGRVAYTVQGQPSGATRNALGNVTATSYNAFGQVISTRQYASQLIFTGGASSGTTLNPATATLAQVSAAVAALPVSASDADGLTTYSYTLDGQVASRTDGLGYQRAYTYDAFGGRTRVQQQLSQPGLALSASNSTISTFAYDARGEQTGESDGVGSAATRSTSTTYDAFGRVTRSTDGNGHVVSYSYDNLGREVSTSQTVQGTVRTTQTTYDAFGRTVRQTDALGNVTVYQYNLAAHTTLVTTPDGVTMTTAKDAFGDTVSVTDGAGDTTIYTYDADGQLLTTKDALGNTATNQYDADGELIQSTDASGHVVTTSYDASGRVLTRTVDPSGLALKTTYSYDGEGRALSVTDPAGVVTTYTYDADGHVLTQVQDAGTGKLNLTTTYSYDGAGKTLTVTVGAGTGAARTTQYVYDNLERLSQQIVDPSGLHLTTSYAYDANGNLVTLTDPKGNVTRYVYDEANEQVYHIDASGAVVQSFYDADRRVTATRTYATAISLSGLGTAPTLADVAARVLQASTDQRRYTVYDSAGRVHYTVDPLGYITEQRYDAAGRPSETLAYAYPVSNQAFTNANMWTAMVAGTADPDMAALVSAAGNTDANAEATLHLYDADGRARFVVQQNTVGGQLVGVVSEQRYDAAGRVIARIAYGSTLPLSTGSALSAQLSTDSVTQALASAPKQISQSVYDNAGRLRYSIDTTHRVTETQVDADGRITAQLTYANAITVPGTLTVATVGAAVAAVGTAGARISSTTYDAAGRVLTTGDALGVNATFTYDATGLQTGHADRDGHWTYDLYDTAGRKTLEQSPPVNVGSWVAGAFQQGVAYLYTTYAYDGVGNVTSISQGTGPDSAHVTVLSTTTYAYDAVNHQVQTTYPGGVSTHVVYNALGQAVVDQDANGHFQYKVYTNDRQVAYAVDADGYVTGTSYDAYGNVTATTRYAIALNTAAISGWTAGQPLTMAQLQQGLVTSANDRTITTTYNQINQKTQVQQSAISYALAMGPVAGTAMAAASPTTTYTYDAYGNVTSTATLIQGANGTSTPAVWATTYTYYDALNRAVLVVTPTGAYTSPQGHVTTTTYDGLGHVLGTTQYATAIATSGLTTATPPSPAALVASATDRTSTFGYDAIGRKTSETDTGEYSFVNGAAALAAGSRVTTLGYDGENRIISLTVNGLTTTTAYDALGRVSSVTSPARQVLVDDWQSILQSTSDEDLTSVSMPSDDPASVALYTTISPRTYVIYDALGNTLVTTVQAGSLAQQTWAWFDARGNQIQVKDANGNEHYTTYDNNGNVLTQSYTLTGNSSSSTVTSSYTYDADNQQLTTAVQRSGQSGYDSYTQVQYNAFGEVTGRGDNNGIEAHYSYDNNGNLTSSPDAKTGATHSYAYDLASHVLVDSSTVTGGAATTWTHNWLDLAGRVVQQRTPSSSASSGVNGNTQTTSTYDRWGNVLSHTDAAGNTTQYQYDCQNHLVYEIEPNVLVVSDTGVRTWTTPTKTWYYNVSGQLIGATDENGHTSWNTYDAGGNLTIAQDATGARTITAYDSLGRAVAQQTPPASTATGMVAHITYTTYDNLNQVTSQGDFLLNSDGKTRTRQAQQTYVLNSHGDRIQVTDALGEVTDAQGNINYVAGHTSYYDYDSQHRVLSSQTPIQHANGWAETFSYDVNGHKTGDTTANGDYQSWVYDYFGRVQSHVDLSGATTSYIYDASSGLLTSETSNWAPTLNDTTQANPGYLPGVLTGSGSSEQYRYEADGQLAQVTQLTGGNTAAWDTYQYDANGNQTVDATYTTDGAAQVVHTETIASYDSHNRLSVETTENPDNSVANSRVVYNYDAAGNRRAVFAQSAYGATATPISGNGGAPTGAVAAQTAQPGQAWNFNVASSFTDNVGFGLTFTNSGALPGWLTLNSNGNLSGTPTTAGSWSITVIATDVNGQSVSSTFTVTVPVVAPVFSAGPNNQVGNVGAPTSFSVPGAVDANDSSLSYSATLSNGAALPGWMSFNASTLTFNGTPPSGSAGTYTLKVIAAAANGGSVSETFTFTVLSIAPVLNGSFSSQSLPETRAFAFSFSASAFNEPDGSTLTYSAGQYQMVPQGEGFPPEEEDSPLPSWMTFYPDTLTFTGTPPASALGQTFKLYVMASNPQGQTAEGYFTITVVAYTQPAPVQNTAIPNQTGVIGGASLNLALPANTFSEPDGGALTYSGMVLIPEHELDYPVDGGTDIATRTITAHWVDISKVGLSINAATGAITGSPTTLDYLVSEVGAGSYEKDASYELEIVATNAQGGTVAGAFTLTNSYAPPVLANALPNVSVNPGQGDVAIVQSNTFYDPAGLSMSYSATLSSGAALPSGLSWSGSYLVVGATVAAGSYAIEVTASAGGQTADTTFTLTVNNVPPVFTGPAPDMTLTQNTAFAFQVPGATDANGLTPIYAPAWVDGSNWVPLPAWLSFDAATRTFSGTPPGTGTWTIAYGAAAGGFNPTQSFVITVNASPTPPQYVGSIANQDFGYLSNQAVFIDASGQFHDPQGEALTYTAMQSDGNGLMAWLSFDPATQVFSGTTPNLTTANDRVWTLQLTASDASGYTSSLTFMIDVQGPETAYTSTMLSMRTLTASPSAAPATTPNIQSYWFTYDADNRVVVSNGALVNGQIGITAGAYEEPSYANQYDAAGNVVVRNTINAATYTVPVGNTSKTYYAGNTMSQQLVYDARNELVESDYAVDSTYHEASLGAQQTMTYDADGHQLIDATHFRGDAVAAAYGTPDFPKGWEYLPIGGWLSNAQITHYNADGTVASQSAYARSSSTDWQRAAIMAVNYQDKTLPDEVDITADGTGPLEVHSTTTYTGYDRAGNVTAYNDASVEPTVFGADYTVSYLKKDGYLEQSTRARPTVSGYIPAVDTSYYDAFGHRLAVAQTSQGNSGAQTTTRAFAYDAMGEIVQRRSGTVSGSTFTPFGPASIDHYSFVNGQQVSAMDEGGGIQVLDTLSGFSSGSSSQGYVVQQGDMLASIAQAVYGNSQLGYIVAEANGISQDSDLVVGQSITIPSVTTSSNTATTFRPYNPNSLIGSTTPNLPAAPPPPSQAGCNTLAAIVIIAVAVVVSVVTYGALSGEMAGWAAGAIAGASASAASQLAGDALGVQHGFSWGQVLVGAVGGAIGGGLGQAFSKGGAFAATFASDAGNGINTVGNAIIGAASYAGTYEADKLSGQAAHFSWVGLVANAAGSAVGGEFGPSNAQATAGQEGGFSWNRVEANIAQDVTTRETSVALGDNHVQSWQQVGEDVFGNALGNAAITGINAYKARSAQQTASFNDWAKKSWTQDQVQLGKWSGDAAQALSEMAFDQRAEALIAASPQLASAGAYSTYTGAYGLPGDSGDTSSNSLVGGTSGTGGLPGPFTEVGSALGTPMLDDLYAQGRALQSRVVAGAEDSPSTEVGGQLASGGVGTFSTLNGTSNLVNDPYLPDLLKVPSLYSYSSGVELNPIYVLKNPYWNPLNVNIDTSFGSGVNSLVANSPTMVAEYNYLTASGWKMTWGPSTLASYTDTSSNTIYVSSSNQDPAAIVSQLAHEFGHALTSPTLNGWLMPLSSNDLPDYGYSFASHNASIELLGEGYATLNNVAAQQEIYNSTGLNIGIASANPSVNVPQYKAIYSNYVSGEEVSYDAAQQIGAIYRAGEIPGGDQTIPVGSPFSTNGSYGTHYFNGFLNTLYNWSHK